MDRENVPNKDSNQVVHNKNADNQSMDAKQLGVETNGNVQNTSCKNG